MVKFVSIYVCVLFFATRAYAIEGNSLITLHSLINQTAYNQPNQLLCKVFHDGLSGDDWVAADMIKREDTTLTLKIIKEGANPHQLNGQLIHTNQLITDLAQDWVPCRL